MSATTTTAAEAAQVYGSKALSEWQLFNCLGIAETTAKELATAYTLTDIAKMNVSDLARIKGIGKTKGAAIVAAIELGRRRQSEKPVQRPQITSSADIYSHVHPDMRDLNVEQFWIVLLDRRSYVVRTECIHIGGMSAMVVDPKVIFQKALEYKASSLVIIHNHPSGHPSPSNEDIRLTEKIKAGGSFIDIKVLDHVIIGDGCYYSFADEGKM